MSESEDIQLRTEGERLRGKVEAAAASIAQLAETNAELRAELERVTREREEARNACVELARDTSGASKHEWIARAEAAEKRAERLEAFAGEAMERSACDHDFDRSCVKCVAADAWSKGHREARMAIDRALEDPGKGSLGDLLYSIKRLREQATRAESAEALLVEAREVVAGLMDVEWGQYNELEASADVPLKRLMAARALLAKLAARGQG